MTENTAPESTRKVSFQNLSIGVRLIIGFGILVILTFLVLAFSYAGSTTATTEINTTEEVRVPSALAASRAQADLLRMLSAVRGYLALGEPQFREDYLAAREDFVNDLDDLERLSSDFDPENRDRYNQLQATFEEWEQWPEQLFALRDDRLDREPAYRLFTIDGVRSGGQVLIGTQQLIDEQGEREATERNIALLADMANFQGSFSAMMSGLRGYVTTQNSSFRSEYEANFELNEIHWRELSRQGSLLTPNQQATLMQIQEQREEFLNLPPEMFDILESDRFREDLFLFRTETIPLTETMQETLAEMTSSQQFLLERDLQRGISGLNLANQQSLIIGAIALVIGIGLALLFRANIAGPIGRLTDVAEQIRAGDLEKQATVESNDEIGTLAQTFNKMTGQLRQTLFQVQKEKNRADSLLDVVIPIGVDLASEKNFNRLLEKMLVEAKTFCNADAGILYLRTEDNKLRYEIVRNDTLGIALGGTAAKQVEDSEQFEELPLFTEEGENHSSFATHVALTGKSINVADASTATEYDGDHLTIFNNGTSYAMTSFLTIPLKNSQDQVIGVMELINAEEPDAENTIAFDENLQQMMESFSSLAVAALEAYIREQSLKQEIQQLRIEIDEVKRKKEVSQIVDTDFFQDLKAKTRDLRRRNRRRDTDSGDE